jgi:hypothetical protein
VVGDRQYNRAGFWQKSATDRARLLTRDAAGRIAATIAKLPELLLRG